MTVQELINLLKSGEVKVRLVDADAGGGGDGGGKSGKVK